MRLFGESRALSSIQSGKSNRKKKKGHDWLKSNLQGGWLGLGLDNTHENIQIWLTMWSQFAGVLNYLVRRVYSSLRVSIIRCAIVLISRFHSSNNSGLFNIKDTYKPKKKKTCQQHEKKEFEKKK